MELLKPCLVVQDDCQLRRLAELRRGQAVEDGDLDARLVPRRQVGLAVRPQRRAHRDNGAALLCGKRARHRCGRPLGERHLRSRADDRVLVIGKFVRLNLRCLCMRCPAPHMDHLARPSIDERIALPFA